MRIGMLVIGTELLQGKITDANMVWLARYLRSWNTRLEMSMIIDDSDEAIQAALTNLYQRCDIVLSSGGLGPTADDITKASIGKFFGKEMIFQASAKKIAQINYERLGRLLPHDHNYEYLPEDFVPLNNPTGFAPGFWFSDGKRSLLAAPGVPRELHSMIEDHFPQIIGKNLSSTEMRLLNFRTRGVPEEKIFNEVDPQLWSKLEQMGGVSSLPHILGVDIGVTLEGDVEKKTKLVQDVIQNSPVRQHVWHEGPESLEEVVVQAASKRGITFGFAESCTGGLCSHRITNISGSSNVFWGSIVSYDNSIKTHLLHVNESTLKAHGAVSEQTAMEMAEGARKELNTTYAISLTGIAGPGGGSSEKPVGTVWIGISHEGHTSAKRHEFKGDRETLKLRFSQIALFTLLDCLKKK